MDYAGFYGDRTTMDTENKRHLIVPGKVVTPVCQ
jgi:hypothetical protein